jgi:hypothetical protein
MRMQQAAAASACLQMCIMAGCDFLASLPGVGLKKAHQQLRKVKGFVKVGSGSMPSRAARWGLGSVLLLPHYTHPQWGTAALLPLCPAPVLLGDDRSACHAQACKAWRFSGTTVPKDYELRFQRALWTFKHQRCACLPLTAPPAGGLTFRWTGARQHCSLLSNHSPPLVLQGV